MAHGSLNRDMGHIRIKPHVLGDLTYAEASIKTITRHRLVALEEDWQFARSGRHHTCKRNRRGEYA